MEHGVKSVFPSYAANRLSRKSSRGSMIFSLQREKKVPLWGMFVPPEGKKSTALVDVRPSRGTPWMSLWRTFEIADWPRVMLLVDGAHVLRRVELRPS